MPEYQFDVGKGAYLKVQPNHAFLKVRILLKFQIRREFPFIKHSKDIIS